MNITENTEIIKANVIYDSLESLMDRKDIIVETVNNAIKRENSENNDYKLSFYKTETSIKEDGRYLLTVLINKEYN